MKNLFPTPINHHYFNRYLKLVEYYKEKTYDGYTEKHHIIPKSLRPEYSKESWNIISVPARVHFIFHYLLWKSYRNRKTWNAFKCMSSNNPHQNRYFNSLLYASLKDSSFKQSDESNKKRSEKLTGRKFSDETLSKMSAWQKGKQKKYKVVYTDERKQKMSASQKGKPRPETTGAGNGRSKSIIFRNIKYGSIKECSRITGLTPYYINKELK
jgi:hypothetical protein